MAGKRIIRERGPWLTIVDNFISSIFGSVKKKIVGKDHLGNVYYETDSTYSKRSRMATEKRGFTPSAAVDMGSEGVTKLPAEWEAWLRGRRKEPPKQDEIDRNLTLAASRKARGDQIAAADDLASLQRKNEGFEEQKSSGLPDIKSADIPHAGAHKRQDFPIRSQFEKTLGAKYDEDSQQHSESTKK